MIMVINNVSAGVLMYVCVCNAVTNRQISTTIASGAHTFKACGGRDGCPCARAA
jgi:bacterioferritin-associated ferredoxin